MNIIYILGSARSGSSLFESELQRFNKGSAFGELRWIFERGIIEDEKCTCGQNFSQCEFWSKMPQTKVDMNYLAYLRKTFDNPIKLAIALRFPKSKLGSKFEIYKNEIRSIYEFLSLENDVIIDNSKSPFYYIVLKYALLKNNQKIVPIHFNRDLLGVMKSYAKNKIREENKNKPLMRKKSAMHVIAYWLAINFTSFLVAHRDPNYVYIRYSDFCNSDSTRYLKSLMSCVSTSHSISGNPDRMQGFSAKREVVVQANTVFEKVLKKLGSFFY